MAGRLERGEVRLYRFPSPDKERPVLILTRRSALGYLARVTVAPITSTIRGVPSEVALGIPAQRAGAYANSAWALMATVPSGVTAHNSQPRPSAVGRPRSSKGAVSKSGARAWVL